ncbi:class I SAM-dependent methyltransferase [Caulobacter endophyticus]|uniref:Uncharacterized protein n=1 Tax=Caulobacter endophyticus TaxID=2172652 RepID=A0A2T9K3Z3_9CAUL|nr:methyltransferase domain-containing protein [Caulobacter endophyticus]PVM90698.1 hypothetical protein DDF67_09725 [Caulobacter endophyticus]
MIASAAFYDPRADQFGERYASARFEDVHRGLLRHLPQTGAAIADIGAGSGRDAYAMAALGYQVTAAEPSSGMRDWAMSSHAPAEVRWIDDALPTLALLRSEKRIFDFVLCSAVLMHLPASALGGCFSALGAITAATGKVAISVRAPTPTDPKQIFHAHTASALKTAASSAGLTLIDHGESVDVLGRDVVKWRWMVFQNGEIA